MAGEDRTEEPTPKRLREARNRGQVAFSKELVAALGLLGAFAAMTFLAGTLLKGYKEVLAAGLQNADQGPSSIPETMHIAMLVIKQSAPLLLLPAVIVGGVGVAVSLAQTQFNFATEALKPDFKRLNPVTGLKKLLGYRGLVEVAKEFFKVGLIGAVAWFVIQPQITDLGKLVGLPAADILTKIGTLSGQLVLWVVAVYLVLALADYMFQRYSTKRELRMTKEEVKQEMRQTDMSGEVKRAIKQRQMEAARSRMMSQVPQADVVITNPTHYAVALKYESGEPAPKVIASGVDLIALDIREKALEAGVEIVENPPLARSLYASCQVGDWIPAELYVAVAEVLAFVYRRRENQSSYSAEA